MKIRVFSMLVLVLVFSLSAVNAHADAFTDFAALNFAVLGASTVTNVPASTINGNVGVYAGTAITGFPGFVAGTNQLSTDGQVAAGFTIDSHTAQPFAAQADATSMFGTLQGLSGTDLTGQDLGGLTLTAGVYKFSSSAFLSAGALTLDFAGASNKAIIIDTGSTLITLPGTSVVLQNWNSTDSVYWAVGSAATIDTTTSFQGNVIALDLVAMNTKATDGCGSVTSLTAAVTLQMNTISTGCNGATETIVKGTGGGTATPTPEPGTLALLPFGLLGLGVLKFRKSRVSSLNC